MVFQISKYETQNRQKCFHRRICNELFKRYEQLSLWILMISRNILKDGYKL